MAQDLSGILGNLIPLCPTSQSEGGEIHDNTKAYSLPGSVPVSAPSATVIPPEVLPLPQLPAQIPVNNQVARIHDAGQPAGEPADRPRDPASGQFSMITVGSGTDKPGHGFTLSPSALGGAS
jgi:hypothetical protein